MLNRSFSRSTLALTNPRPPYPRPKPNHPESLPDNVAFYPIGQPSQTTRLDDAYISRYRDPSHHDDYTLSDHHHPYTFRARSSATQPLPRRPPPKFDATQNSFEAREARLEMERSWASLQQPGPSTCSLPKHVSTPALQDRVPRMGLCFPGSGSQYIGMGSFLTQSRAFQDTWDEAEQALLEFEKWRQSLDLVDRLHALGYSPSQAQLLGGPMLRGALRDSGNPGLKDVVFRGPRYELTRSSNAQPAILITSLAYLRALEADCGTSILTYVEALAGHSSGEYTACVAAGVMTFANAVHLTRLHGMLTTRTLELNRLEPSTALDAPPDRRALMSALIINTSSHNLADLKRVLEELQASLAHHGHGPAELASVNSETQVVLSGSRAGVLAACDRLRDLDIAHRAADLPCAAPFHCSFMSPAADGMAIALESVPLQRPLHPILLSSPTGQTNQADSGSALRAHLAQAIRSPVMWASTVAEFSRMKALDAVLFVGPGKALANLGKKGNLGKRVLSLATANDFERVRQEILDF